MGHEDRIKAVDQLLNSVGVRGLISSPLLLLVLVACHALCWKVESANLPTV